MDLRTKSASLGLPAVLALVFAFSLPSSCDNGKKQTVIQKPPPFQKSTTAPGAYDYKHALQPKEKSRRPVVALLRPGDVVALKDYLPFGRGVAIVGRRGDETAELNVTWDTGAPVLVTPAQRQFLMRELVRSRDFVLVERERILEVIRELDFGQTKYVDQKTKPKLGQIIGVHYILEAAFFPAGSGPAASSIWAEMAKSAAKRRGGIDPARNATVYISAYDVETGQVVAVAFGAGRNDAVAAKKAVEDLISEFADVEVPIRVMRVDENSNPIIDIGSQEGVKKGDKFVIDSKGGEVLASVEKVELLSSTVTIVSGSGKDVKSGDLARRQVKETKPAEKPAS